MTLLFDKKKIFISCLIFLLNSPALSNQNHVFFQCQISQSTLTTIANLSQFIQKPNLQKKKTTAQIFANLLKEIQSDPKFNKKLQGCKTRHPDFFQQTHPEFFNALLEFSFKAPQNYSKINQKIERLLSFIGTNHSPSQHEKLTIPELRLLVSLVSFHENFENFLKWFYAEKFYDPDTLKLLSDLKKAKYLHQEILLPLKNDPTQQQFLWIAYDFKKDFLYRKLNPHLIMIIQPIAKILGFHIEHTSLSFRSKNHIYEAHMWGQPSVFKMSEKPIISYLYSSFRLNYKKLIPQKNYLRSLEKIKMLYGEHWESYIDHEMTQTINDYFSNSETFSKLYNSKSRRFKMMVHHHIHYKKYKLQQQSLFSHSGNTTCSEFTMKALLQSLHLLNKKIQFDWEQTDRLGTAPYFSIDILSYSKIKKLSPQNITQKMIKQKILLKIPPPQSAKRFIHFSN